MAARYRHHCVVLLRSTTDPGDLDLPRDLDLADPVAVEARGSTWLAKTWSRQDVRDAVTAASSDNHPSGNPEPSATDRDATLSCKAAAQATGLRFLGHLVLGEHDTWNQA